MPTVYKGPAPGHGGFFKWDDAAHRSPKLALFNNVFRVDQLPNHGSLGLPDGYLSHHLGFIPVDGSMVPEAISKDPQLNDAKRKMLLNMYRALVALKE